VWTNGHEHRGVRGRADLPSWVVGSNGTEDRLKSRVRLGVRFEVVDFWCLDQCAGSHAELAGSDRCLWLGGIRKVVDPEP
jgi:hypothetical protein